MAQRAHLQPTCLVVCGPTWAGSKFQPPTGWGVGRLIPRECRLSPFAIFLPVPFLWTDWENRIDLRREPGTAERKARL